MNYLKELKDIDDELLYFKESIYEEKLESLQEEIMTIKEGNRQDIRAKDKELEKIKDNALNSAHAMYKYQMGALESQYAQDKQAIEDEMNIQAGYIRRAIIANMIEEGSKKRFRFDNNTNDKDYNSFFSSHGNSTSSNHSSSTSRNHSSSTSRNHSNSSSNHGNSTSDNHVNPMAHNQKIAASNKQSITTINKHKSKTHHPNIHPHSHDNANKLKATQKDEYITPNNKYTYSKVSIKRKIDTLLAIADRRQTAHQRLERNTLDDIARASVDDIERDLIEMRRKY
ncbi:hypothetical protein BDB01DRAFT_142606 [Pilobolus umbonatus]|nr:hypothetical protein BDB01DRAFT_142606 [Pilobolus umbonatus]